MLSALFIRDIVLLESLDLTFSATFMVLTGATGVGTSVLLDDAFALVRGGYGDDHMWIATDQAKSGHGETLVTGVGPLDGIHRRAEIARMLAGSAITEEARAAARRYIGGAV